MLPHFLNHQLRVRVLTLCCALAATTGARAENWPQWRGPFFNGSTTEQRLPESWDQTNGVAWTAPLPGFSGATPIVWNDAIFVSSPDTNQDLRLFCLDRRTGSTRWQAVVGTGNREVGRNNLASPSPVTDGHRVFALFGSGDLAAYDFTGRKIWSRNLASEYGKFANMWQYGSSPLLWKGRLYLQVLQRNPVPDDYAHALGGSRERESFLLCLDPGTGTNIFRHVRPTDAREESMESYATPIPCQGHDGEQILVVGGDYLTAHDPVTGAEIWRCAGFDPQRKIYWRTVPSPVYAVGMIIGCAPQRDPVLGIRDEGGHGDWPESRIAWRFKEFPSDCATPLFYQGRLYILDGDRQKLTSLDPVTGEKISQIALGVHEIFRASPTGADGRIYCVSENGTVVVLDAAKELRILATIRMGEGPVRSSIVAAQGALFLRTAQNLYCLPGPNFSAKP